jgi:acylglycerol lipase
MIKSTNNINLFTKNYLLSNPIANVLIVHGLSEHCLRYAHVAEAFNTVNMAVYTFDLRGHGQSEGARSQVSSIDEFREDVEVVYRTIPKNIPFFILGHSMGGLIVTNFLLFNKCDDVRGAILSGAALEIGIDVSPFLLKMANFLGKYLPNLKTQKLDPKLISTDPIEVKKYATDPLNYLEGMKAGLGSAILKAINSEKLKFINFDYPVLIMHGGADKITNPNGSISLFEKAKSSDKTLKIWEGDFHEIFNEVNKKEVIEMAVNWAVKRV